jgi:aspartyl-tRNA(Asn)/glutamyl-tRNA(Gln) amidotransferase subunit A
MDHPGPIGRCAADLAILFSAMRNRKLGQFSFAFKGFENVPPSLLVVGGFFHEIADADVQNMMEEVAHHFAGKEAQLLYSDLPPAFGDWLPRHRIVMAVEAAQFHEPRLHRHPEDYQPRIRELLEEGLSCPAPEYARCKDHQTASKQDVNAIAREHVMLTPATTCAAPDAATTGNPAFNSPWSYTGLPTVSIPVGFAPNSLPLAIQLVGCLGADEMLLHIAAWCEQALGFGSLTPPFPR